VLTGGALVKLARGNKFFEDAKVDALLRPYSAFLVSSYDVMFTKSYGLRVALRWRDPDPCLAPDPEREEFKGCESLFVAIKGSRPGEIELLRLIFCSCFCDVFDVDVNAKEEIGRPGAPAPVISTVLLGLRWSLFCCQKKKSE